MAAMFKETKFDIGNMVCRCSPTFIADDINSRILLLKPGESAGLSGCSSDHIINVICNIRAHITTLFNIMISHRFVPIYFRLCT